MHYRSVIIIGKKLTNEEFIKRLSENECDVTPLEEYKRSDVSIYFKCNKCGAIFKNSPIRILGTRNQRCPNCYHLKQRMNKNDFYKKAEQNKNIVVVGEYQGSKTKIDVKCIHCNTVFKMRADSILDGRGHTPCIQKMVIRQPKKTQEEFIKELKKINNKIIPLDIYTKGRDKMNFKCLICNTIWNSRIDHILHGDSGCPHCNISKGENKIKNFLIENNIKYMQQYRFDDCKDINHLPFDFYLPDYNTCIEFDGEQHVRPAFGEASFYKTVLHDGMKNNYCKWNNINLIRIPHTNFDNIEKILYKFINNR